jgi:HAD superfamily hydrolase (TIGR01509 family)
MTFAAAIFDLDGTLIDTERLAIGEGIAAFAAAGIAVDPAVLHGLVGKDDVTSSGILARLYPALDPVAFREDWGRRFLARLDSGIPLRPQAAEVLAAVALPKAVATSSTRVQADRKLAMTGLARHFAAVVTYDDVSRPKPDPEPFLRAATLLGVDPGQCVAFEDSETGARSARAAGMVVVQVPDIVPTVGEHAHHVAPDLMAGARAVGLV